MVIRLLIVQYAGDYREAFKRLSIGGDETYYAQKYSVDAVAEIGKKINEAATLCCLTEERYNELLENGVRAIGAGFDKDINIPELIKLLEEYNPTHLIIRTPIRQIISWAIKRKVKTLITLADSFQVKGLRIKIKNYLLASLLNNRQIDWIGNHGLTSCISLADIGVSEKKIIPWDFPYKNTPSSFSPKTLASDKNIKEVLYVGTITEAKGIGDALKAIFYLKSEGLSIKLKIVGKGDIENFQKQTKDLQIEDFVEFVGLVPNKLIISLMRKADLVVIPSRHEYPEGFPLVIYEAFCSRTPIIASDHPMFRSKLINKINALVFPANDSVALALCIKNLLSEPELYHNLSLASYEAWKSLQIPVKWDELINRWLFDSQENKKWLFEHSLSSGKYKDY